MKQWLFIGLLLMTYSSYAQLKGVVYGSNESNKTKLYGAKIRLVKSGIGAFTNEEGEFELVLPKDLPDTLVISAMGYYSDTIVVDKKDRFALIHVTLYSEHLLPEVVVSIKRDSKSISRLKTFYVEEISPGELRKAACCNLSESFETNASVDVNLTDAVSGAKRIQMMGLDGVYTQMQFENIPFLNGLESSYGLTSLPGTWIESIQITKGTGTVVNGYESMAGLINLELKKPTEMERFYLNAYANRMGRSELNMHSGVKLNEKWSTALFAHGSVHPIEMDWNNDGFRDMPNGSNFAFMNRYAYHGSKMEAQFGVNAYMDDKIGGQISSIRRDSSQYYNVELNSRHFSAFAKTGFFLKKSGRSIGVVYNYKHQEQEALFGNVNYSGQEERGYVNLIYDGLIGTTIHKYKLGLSLVLNNIEQRRENVTDNRDQLIPGIFGEYTYTGLRLSAVIGARGDFHNVYGAIVSPRAHFKYILTEKTDVRLTGGRGWRVPNYMIDNVSLMATSREWVKPDTIIPEVSWNAGASIVHEIKLFNRKAVLSVDYYFTYFENQLVVDRDEDPALIVFKNVQGNSFSNSLQTEFSFSPLRGLDIRLAYKYLDVRAEFNGILRQRVMVPKHRGFVNFAFTTRNKKWEYDLTTSIFGKARLPRVLVGNDTYSEVNMSEVWPSVSAQLTYNFRKLDVYLGGENLLDYTQQDPIISASEPFGTYFNATRIWAPVYGMNVYLGIRFAIENKNKN